MIQADPQEKLLRLLTLLYGKSQATPLLAAVKEITDDHLAQTEAKTVHDRNYTSKDTILITYADQLYARDIPPLQSLKKFLQEEIGDTISGVHILPLFPSSSDDGFSVIDYRKVDPEYGTWEDVHEISHQYRLMMDAVINHISSQSTWFTGFLAGEPRWQKFFISVDPGVDLSMVVRPRDRPLLTPFQTPEGIKHIWTTFSPDQIDLNFAHSQVLLEIIDLLLYYVRQGANLIRLDAIAFIWKEIGTSCIHLPQTHAIVQIFRSILDAYAPDVLMITETNVPHAENVSYFGDGTNEAQMVYQFALPPLTLHALLKGSALDLSRWVCELELPSNEVTFFNFLASHDGIGLRPIQGVLSEEDIDYLISKTEERGGRISYRSTKDGGRQPYELNINYLSALTPPEEVANPTKLTIDRFIASQAIMLSLQGLPGIYFHSLVGSLNWSEGVKRTGLPRSINRQKLEYEEIASELNNPESIRSRIFQRYLKLLRARSKSTAFDPYGKQSVFSIHPAIFSILRISRDEMGYAVCLHNLSDQYVEIEFDLWGLLPSGIDRLMDLHGDSVMMRRTDEIQLTLAPYDILWMCNENEACA